MLLVEPGGNVCCMLDQELNVCCMLDQEADLE